MDISKVYGVIQITGYSHDNKFASFQLYMRRPSKLTIAFGIYNFERGVTFIRKTKLKWEFGVCWLDISKKILATNDWDDNVRIVRKRHSYIPLSTFEMLRSKCVY